MKLLKGLGIALILFYMVIFIGINFVTVGVDNNDDSRESFQQVDKKIEDNRLKAEMKDAEILSKFYNEKGYFIVVYNGTTKAPEVLQVDFSEWQYMRIGELY